jgi:hypothetical protein
MGVFSTSLLNELILETHLAIDIGNLAKSKQFWNFVCFVFLQQSIKGVGWWQQGFVGYGIMNKNMTETSWKSIEYNSWLHFMIQMHLIKKLTWTSNPKRLFYLKYLMAWRSWVWKLLCMIWKVLQIQVEFVLEAHGYVGALVTIKNLWHFMLLFCGLKIN